MQQKSNALPSIIISVAFTTMGLCLLVPPHGCREVGERIGEAGLIVYGAAFIANRAAYEYDKDHH